MHISRVSQARSLVLSSASVFVCARDKEPWHDLPSAEHAFGGEDAEKKEDNRQLRKRKLGKRQSVQHFRQIFPVNCFIVCLRDPVQTFSHKGKISLHVKLYFFLLFARPSATFSRKAETSLHVT